LNPCDAELCLYVITSNHTHTDTRWKGTSLFFSCAVFSQSNQLADGYAAQMFTDIRDALLVSMCNYITVCGRGVTYYVILLYMIGFIFYP